jgi:hypothetical protein
MLSLAPAPTPVLVCIVDRMNREEIFVSSIVDTLPDMCPL